MSASDSDEQRVRDEEWIYQVFVDGAEGNEEEAWAMYEAFREHQQEKCAYEADQIYQVSLKGGGGVVDEAREMFEAFRECQKQQNQRWEQRGEEEEEAVDEQKEEEPEQGQGPEQGVFAGLLERTYKLNYQTEVRDSSLEELSVQITPTNLSELSDDLIDLTEQPGVYACWRNGPRGLILTITRQPMCHTDICHTPGVIRERPTCMQIARCLGALGDKDPYVLDTYRFPLA